MPDKQRGHIELSQEEMDRVIAIDAYQHDPAKAKKLAYIAQEVFRNGMIDPSSTNQDYCLDCLNPLSILSTPTGPNALISPALPPATAKERMALAATQAWQSVKDTDAKYREIGADLLFYGSLTAASVAFPEATPGVAATARLLYPPLKAAASAALAVQVDAKTPNLTADFTTKWVAWSYEQVRDNTEAGQAITQYFSKLSDNDVNEILEKTPVRAVLAQMAAASAERSSEEAAAATSAALLELGEQADLQEHISTSLDEIHQDLASWKEAAVRPSPPDVTGLRNVEGSFLLANYALELAGNDEGARTAATIANAAGKIGDLVEKAAEMAPMMLAAGYVGVALAVFSALQSAKSNGPPYDAIFAQLNRISEQIESLPKRDARYLGPDRRTTGQPADPQY